MNSEKHIIHPVTRQSLKVIALAGICVCAFMFHIWFRTLVITQGFEVGRLQKKLQLVESRVAMATVQRNQIFSSRELDRWVQLYEGQGVELAAPKSQQIIYLPRALVDENKTATP